MKKLFLRDGKLWYNEFPEEPQYDAADSVRSVQKMHYNKSVDESKIAAVEILIYSQATPDLSLAKDVRGWWIQTTEKYFGELMQEGQLYEVAKGWTVEISKELAFTPEKVCYHCLNNQHDLCTAPTTCQCNHVDTPWWKSIARLISLKEQSSGIAESLPFLNEDNWVVNEKDIPQVQDQLDQLLAGIPAKPIPILDAKRIAENYNYNQVVIIARKIGDNGIEHVTTYGTDKANCDVAAHIGDFLRYEIMKWEKKSVSPPPQESQDELWKDLFRKYDAPTWYNAGNEFTITRKAKP